MSRFYIQANNGMKASFSFSLLFHIAVILTVFFLMSVSRQNAGKRTFFVTLANPDHCAEKNMPKAKTEKTGESKTKIVEPKVQVKTVIHEVRPEKRSVNKTGPTETRIKVTPVSPILDGKTFLYGIPSGNAEIKGKEEITGKNPQGSKSSLSSGNFTMAANLGRINSRGRACSGGLPVQVLNEGYVNEHLDYILELIEKNLKYPFAARRMAWAGTVVIAFVITVDGHACKVRVIKTSGYSVLDDNAVDTIKKISSFPRPRASVELTIPITYRLE